MLCTLLPPGRVESGAVFTSIHWTKLEGLNLWPPVVAHRIEDRGPTLAHIAYGANRQATGKTTALARTFLTTATAESPRRDCCRPLRNHGVLVVVTGQNQGRAWLDQSSAKDGTVTAQHSFAASLGYLLNHAAIHRAGRDLTSACQDHTSAAVTWLKSSATHA